MLYQKDSFQQPQKTSCQNKIDRFESQIKTMKFEGLTWEEKKQKEKVF